MDSLNIMEVISNITMVVGTASLLLKGLEYAARNTKTKKDDIKVAQLRAVITFIGNTLHFVAASPRDKKVLMEEIPAANIKEGK